MVVEGDSSPAWGRRMGAGQRARLGDTNMELASSQMDSSLAARAGNALLPAPPLPARHVVMPGMSQAPSGGASICSSAQMPVSSQLQQRH